MAKEDAPITLGEDRHDLCHAGRYAFLGGEWRTPCRMQLRHIIGTEGMEMTIALCDRHFREANRYSLITDIDVGEQEFKRRRRAIRG